VVRAHRDVISTWAALTVLYCGSALCTVLQAGSTPLKLAAMYDRADAVQALLDAGADRYAEVRMTPCSLMTAHNIILSMGILL